MNRNLPVIICTGRALNDHGQPIGQPCGRRLVARSVTGGNDDPRTDTWGLRPPTPEEHAIQARAAGWRTGPLRNDGTRDAMCPSCSRPDPTTAAICRDLEKGLTRK